MTPRDFCYWLQGHFEITKPASLTGQQLQIIKRHLAIVFTHQPKGTGKKGKSWRNFLNAPSKSPITYCAPKKSK